jgi:hypothetical protein
MASQGEVTKTLGVDSPSGWPIFKRKKSVATHTISFFLTNMNGSQSDSPTGDHEMAIH